MEANFNIARMFIRILTLFLFLSFSAAQQGQTECRVCPERCQTIPREDGGCQICICDGVAKSDCKTTSCQNGCRKELDAEGCNVCICDPICPSVPECPESCEQKLGDDGCIVCDCGDNNNICDSVPACPKGCIEMRTDTKCFSCNCTLPEETFSRPGGPFTNGGFGGRPFRGRPNGGNQFGRNPFEGNTFVDNSFGGGLPQNVEGNRFGGGFNFFENDNNRRRPITPTQNQPFGGFPNQPFGRPPNRPSLFDVASGSQTSRCPAVQCPRDCRITMDEDGCRQCLCGDDAVMCPGVSLCFGRCLNTNPETNCCQCNCIEETEAAVSKGGSFGTTLIFTRNGVTAIISPDFEFLGPRRPGLRPGRRPGQQPELRPEQGPIIPNEDDAEGFSPQRPEIQPEIFEPQNPLIPNGQTPINTESINPFNPNFSNPANPNENGNIPPVINSIDPSPPISINPAIDPNIDNNNPTITVPVIPGSVESQNPIDEACPNVDEVTCGGECQPIAGPDGCPICECGLLRRRNRPVIIVDENAPPIANANADASANGDAEIIP